MRSAILNPELPQEGNWWLLPLGLAVAFGLALAFPWLLSQVSIYGHFIPESDPTKDYLLAWFWAIGLEFLLVALPLREKASLLVLWPIKVGVTLGVMLLVENHYRTLDGYSFAYWSAHPDSTLAGNSGVFEVVRWLGSITGHGYHALKVLFSFAGLWGLYAIYRTTRHFLGRDCLPLLWAIMLLPTAVFWSSQLEKDPLNLLGTGWYALGVCGWLRTDKKRYLAVGAAGILLATWIRPWYAAIMLVPLSMVVVTRLRGMRSVVTALALLGVTAAGVLVFQKRLLAGATVANFPAVATTISNSFADQRASGLEGNMVSFTSNLDVIRYAPVGAFAALFQPLPWDANNSFMLLASAENTVSLLLFTLAIFRFRLWMLRDSVFRWAVAFILCWSALYGFASPGDFGTGVRFRLEIAPIGMLLTLLLLLPQGRARLGELVGAGA